MGEKLTTFETGVGAKVEIVPLGKGDTDYPKRITITVTTAATKNATTVAVSGSVATSGQTLKIPAGACLAFTDPITGSVVSATVTTAVSIALSTGSGPYTGTGSIALDANHLVIPINSTSSNFIILGARSTATSTVTLADEQLRTFDSTLFDQGQIVGAAGEFSCDGAFSAIDAGLTTVANLTIGATAIDGTTVICTPGNYMWVVVTTPAPAAGFTSGVVRRAICYCTDQTLDIQAGAISKQSLPFKVNGSVYTDPAVVT
jgi:hypothetical protein